MLIQEEDVDDPSKNYDMKEISKESSERRSITKKSVMYTSSPLGDHKRNSTMTDERRDEMIKNVSNDIKSTVRTSTTRSSVVVQNSGLRGMR